MSRAVLSVGSNLGDRLELLQLAVDGLRPWIRLVSPVFATPPWGPVRQGEYLNAVLLAEDPEATPVEWLRRSQRCEAAAGRTRDVRWGPRTLDVDVISVDGVISDDPQLTLPHPRAVERAFVLLPWWAVDPEATLPGRGPVVDLIRTLSAAAVEEVRLLPGVELRVR
jgi:2-amino-4-hydroxy-6-hydroxymethyldihydropteridine diphosphokinase